MGKKITLNGENINMWNEKHDVYGWNLNRHPETDKLNPCEGCFHFIGGSSPIVNYQQLKVRLAIVVTEN